MIRRSIVVAATIWVGLTSAHAHAATTSVASIVGVDAAPLASGGSGTGFSIVLPAGAQCAGDSANAGFRVQSYMVPASVDPTTLNFGSIGPRPPSTGAAFRQPLYTTTSSAFVNAQTANAEKPTDPGAVVNIPTFNLGVFAPGEVPAGAYNIGIACTSGTAANTVVDRVWNTRISIAVDPSDSPVGIRWRNDALAATDAVGVEPQTSDLSEVQGDAVASASSSAYTPVTGDAPRPRRSEPTGGPPTMSLPVLELTRGLPVVGVTIASCALLALFALRIAYLSRRASSYDDSSTHTSNSLRPRPGRTHAF